MILPAQTRIRRKAPGNSPEKLSDDAHGDQGLRLCRSIGLRAASFSMGRIASSGIQNRSRHLPAMDFPRGDDRCADVERFTGRSGTFSAKKFRSYFGA
jgi:hypothetical protein